MFIGVDIELLFDTLKECFNNKAFSKHYFNRQINNSSYSFLLKFEGEDDG